MEITIDIVWFLGFLGVGVIAGYLTFKWKLHQIRTFIDDLDNAVMDDEVTEEEFGILWRSFRNLFSKKK